MRKNAKDFLAELFFRDTYKNRYMKKTDCKSVKKEGLRKSMVLRLLKRGK